MQSENAALSGTQRESKSQGEEVVETKSQRVIQQFIDEILDLFPVILAMPKQAMDLSDYLSNVFLKEFYSRTLS